jgi:hypothetical protein
MGIDFSVLMSFGPHFLTCTASSGVLDLGIDSDCLEGLQRNQGPEWLRRYSDRLCAGRLAVRFPAGEDVFSTPQRPDRLWGPPRLLYKGYHGLLPPG